jgi:solute carrier family 10 (sodium/bile acid cotransporter), member 7
MSAGRIGRYWFLWGLAGAAALAFVVPELGARGGPLRPEITTKVGVALIFLMQGLAISPAALRTGALRWRLHLTVQLFVFAAFPLAMILLDTAGGRVLPADLRLGFLFLAILPTTISTCVVFTAAAGGNTSGALFNSVFANSAGVVLTPLWAALLLQARGEAPPLPAMMGEIGLLLLAPLAAGQAIRPLLRRVREPNPRVLVALSNVIILYIVFAAFSASVLSGAFLAGGWQATALVALAAIGFFAAATATAATLGRRLGFDAGDRRALLFCAPQKTLAAGAPMGQVLFAGHPGLGLILLPIMIYHAVQLLVGAALASRLREELGAAATREGHPPAHGRETGSAARSTGDPAG